MYINVYNMYINIYNMYINVYKTYITYINVYFQGDKGDKGYTGAGGLKGHPGHKGDQVRLISFILPTLLKNIHNDKKCLTVNVSRVVFRGPSDQWDRQGGW